MRSFGRQCRGQGKVFVTLVRQTERQLLDLGSSIENWAQDAKELLHQDTHLREAQRSACVVTWKPPATRIGTSPSNHNV